MAHDVFISYSSKDKSVADATCAVLEARGVRCWMAPRDILPGSEWGAAIIGAIASSKVMVLIYTSSSNASPQVRREVERAVARGLHVIPFRVEDVPMSPALEYFISTPHWLDALSPPLERHLDQLGKIIRAVLDAQKSTDQTAVQDAAAADAASGWSHGPPPGAFSPGASAGAVSKPAAPTTATAPTRNRTPLIVAGAAAAVVVIGGVIFVASRPGGGGGGGGGGDKTQVSTSDGGGTSTVVAPGGTNVGPTSAPDTKAPPAPPETSKPPELPPPVAPAVNEDEQVAKLWQLIGEGAPAVPRLNGHLQDFPKLVDRKNAAGNTPLFDAARGGDAKVVGALLATKADRKLASRGGNLPLHGAALGGIAEKQIIDDLAAGGARNAKNADGNTPLHLALASNHLETAKLLIDAGADVDAADKDGRTPLQLALGLKDQAQARAAALALVNAGAKCDAPDARGMAPLHYAASSGDTGLVTAMIDHGAKVDRPGPGGRTPLHLAALAGKVEVVKALLVKKAPVIAADEQGYMPLHLAATLPDTATAEALMAGGAKVASVNSKDRNTTPLHLAAAAGNVPMVELFMRNGGADVLASGRSPSPVDAAQKAGKTAVVQLLQQRELPALLQSAISSPDKPVNPRLLEAMKNDPKLVEAGVTGKRNALFDCAAAGNAAFAAELIKLNPELVGSTIDGSFDTPLHVAAASKRANVVKLLLASGAKVRTTNDHGDTALHAAARAGAADVVNLLLDAGSDPGYANKDGQRPSDVAADANTKTLLAAGEKEADVVRDAWSSIELPNQGFSVKAPGLKEPLRIRFRSRTEYSVEGYINNGAYTSRRATYTKGPLTLSLESPEGPLFPNLPGTSLSGKVMPATDGKGFMWKVGGVDVQFE
jgi:ankyrin repeat protein